MKRQADFLRSRLVDDDDRPLRGIGWGGLLSMRVWIGPVLLLAWLIARAGWQDPGSAVAAPSRS